MTKRKISPASKKEKTMREKIFEVFKDLGWEIMESEENALITNTSPAGEEINLMIDKRANFEDEIRYFIERIENFDKEEHITRWVNAKAQGMRGVPPIATLVEDADKISAIYKTLAQKLNEVINEKEDEKEHIVLEIVESFKITSGEDLKKFFAKNCDKKEIKELVKKIDLLNDADRCYSILFSLLLKFKHKKEALSTEQLMIIFNTAVNGIKKCEAKK